MVSLFPAFCSSYEVSTVPDPPHLNLPLQLPELGRTEEIWGQPQPPSQMERSGRLMEDEKVGRLWVWSVDLDLLETPGTCSFWFLGCCCVLMLLQQVLVSWGSV